VWLAQWVTGCTAAPAPSTRSSSGRLIRASACWARFLRASYTRVMTTDYGSREAHLPTGTPLEGFRRLVPIEARPYMPKIRCGILDTNVVLNNIACDVRTYPRPTAIRLLVALGVLRPYVGPHVIGEVEEHLDRYMLERRLNPVFARSIWEREYRPRLWVCDPGVLWRQDSRVATLAARDPDDLPTAQLAILLGQKALSEDPDLTEYGLASGEPWLKLVFATGSVARGETVDLGVMIGASISMQAVGDAARAARQLAATPRGEWTLVVLGAGLALVVLGVFVLRHLHEPSRRWIDENTRRGVHLLVSGGKVAIGAYATVSISRMHGEVDLRVGVVAEAHSPSPIQRAARMLAMAEAPISTRDVAAVLWGYKRVPRAALQRSRALLESTPAFVEVAQDRWQLGRLALPWSASEEQRMRSSARLSPWVGPTRRPSS
jgi:hypothetical protein